MKIGFLKSIMRRFRFIALCEGISFILLLFIAMPLKYLADMPAAVLYVGWMHWTLFVLYMILLGGVWVKYNWSMKKGAGAFLASIIPFGTFVLDRKLRKEYGE